MNLDISILTETKIHDDIYTRSHAGYNIRTSSAPSAHQGGVALVWRDTPSFSIEALHFPSPNLLVWLLMGVYLTPNEPVDDICDIMVQTRNKHPNLDCIVTGDLNVDLQQTNPSPRDQTILDTLDFLGVSDMRPHFRQRHNFRGGYTWQQYREGRWIRSVCDYVLAGCSRKHFQRIRISNPRHYDSDHYAVCFSLFQRRPRAHQRYIRGRRAFPLHVNPKSLTPTDHLLQTIPIRKPHKTPLPTLRSTWISDYTWVLVDRCANFRRTGLAPTDPTLTQLNRDIWKSLKRDRRRRTSKAGDEIQQLLNDNDIRSAWTRLKHWYKQVSGRPLRPSPIDMQHIHSTFNTLFSDTPTLPDTSIPINYVPSSPILDTCPTEKEILLAVSKLRRNKA
jgi:hypothetical protein